MTTFSIKLLFISLFSLVVEAIQVCGAFVKLLSLKTKIKLIFIFSQIISLVLKIVASKFLPKILNRILSPILTFIPLAILSPIDTNKGPL